jgi:hypothetical protein
MQMYAHLGSSVREATAAWIGCPSCFIRLISDSANDLQKVSLKELTIIVSSTGYWGMIIFKTIFFA